MRSEAGSVRIIAVSGYLSDFTLGEVGEILLATHVGGEGLDHWHGFPVRAVVPSRRGWFWVKWLTGVEVLTGPRAAMPDLSAPRLTAQTPALLRHSG
jgi:DMSO/TMAO reductase YedYZ molybdopterin-dependent catalytic subunit